MGSLGGVVEPEGRNLPPMVPCRSQGVNDAVDVAPAPVPGWKGISSFNMHVKLNARRTLERHHATVSFHQRTAGPRMNHKLTEQAHRC